MGGGFLVSAFTAACLAALVFFATGAATGAAAFAFFAILQDFVLVLLVLFLKQSIEVWGVGKVPEGFRA